jgi:hypothetical protein
MVYAILFAVAIALNIGCKRSLLLTLVVGLSALMPMQMVTTALAWWTICLGFELVKMVLSYHLNVRVGYPLLFINSLMLLSHLSLLVTTDWQPHTIIVPALEHLEIISCALFSIPSLLYLKRKFRCLKI